MTAAATALELAARGLGLDYGTVALVESDERWREAFERLATELRARLGDTAVGIEHIGSTAVSGLPSKPILDVAVRLAPTADLEKVIALLERHGFDYRGDKGDLGGHLFVLEARVRHRVAHIHVVDYGDESWGRYLAFRDRLRQDADARARYAAAKRDLARTFPESRPGYTAEKASVVAAILGGVGDRTDVAPRSTSAGSRPPIPIVRRGYDVLGARYQARFHESPVRLRFLDKVLDRLPHAGLALDLGCGPGDPTTRSLAARAQVVGVDISAAQLALARRTVPTAAFVLADITNVWFRPESFDAVVSFYVLGHVPRELQATVLEGIAIWLRPGGIVVLNAPVGENDGVEEEWLGVPMFFAGIGGEATLGELRNAGLRMLEAEPVIEDEGDGSTSSFLWVVAEKGQSGPK